MHIYGPEFEKHFKWFLILVNVLYLSNLNYMFNVQVSKQVIVDTSSETHGPSEKRDRLWVSDDVEVTQGFIRTAQESMARINTCNKNNSLEIWLGSELKIQQKFKEHKWIWYNLLDFD